MSGHSKWANIHVKKSIEDKKRAKIFTQLTKNIMIAVRASGNGDPNMNPSLRIAVDKARQANMPNENIQRAIKRGQGVGDGGQLEEVTYEGYGPHGVGFLVIVRTDNKMRTGAEIRHLFDKAGGSLGGPGSAMYLFARSGDEYVSTIPLELEDEEQKTQVMELFDAFEEHDDVEAVYMNMPQDALTTTE